MLRNRLYYTIKPLVPWSVRNGIRRWFARRKMPEVQDFWPILKGSERPPKDWPGWPGGKKFAFVLTHDVEGPEGVAKCRRLMQLEQTLGFRSSVNFIPEGPYQVPRALREELVQAGFEVGVHDLHHDGRLYASRASFAQSAQTINAYVREWGVVGFRSGFMLHNLDWLHQLDIQYDASTFDTDPFEPQPDHVGTIFPFWVPRPTFNSDPILDPNPDPNQHLPSDFGFRDSDFAARRAGYVELPYTLPQDSTLFLVLQEKSPEIWLRKLDWLAQNGGMALVNVHPDYVQFPGEAAQSSKFPVGFYRQLLEHVRLRYGSEAWHALPREVAAFVKRLPGRPLLQQRRRVCMITHSFYQSDNRVIRYAESLAARGDSVDVLGLRAHSDQPRMEVSHGVRVVHLQDRFSKDESGPSEHLIRTLRFFFVASAWVTRHQIQRPYDLLHIHNIPDFLVFAAWYPRLRGAKVILDIHDIVPEFFASKYGQKRRPAAMWALKLMERWSAKFAHHVIIANDLWLEKYATRTRSNGKCTVFINNVNRTIFRPGLRSGCEQHPVIIFPGGLQWHQGVDIAIRAMPRVLAVLPNAEFHVYGDGNMRRRLMFLTSELGLEKSVRFFPPLPHREVASKMANAALGVVPKRADSFGNEAYSTKIMEFMALRVPVVVSDTKVDRHYFNNSIVRFFESGNAEALSAAILETLQNREETQERVARAAAYAEAQGWESRKQAYFKLVDDLCAR